MTNYEMIKSLDIYAMALTMMCPYEAGFLDNYRCDSDRGGKCGKCTLEWLLEETSE